MVFSIHPEQNLGSNLGIFFFKDDPKDIKDITSNNFLGFKVNRYYII